MTKQILDWYMDAEKELRLVEEDIQQAQTVHDSVLGSMTEHPYILHTIRLEGMDPKLIGLLCEKRKKLKALRWQAEEFLAKVEDPYMGTAIRLRYIKGFSWQQVADEMSGNSEESIKKMVYRYLKKMDKGGNPL